jgi:hypothetical protein
MDSARMLAVDFIVMSQRRIVHTLLFRWFQITHSVRAFANCSQALKSIALPENLRGERFGAILNFQISRNSGTHHS